MQSVENKIGDFKKKLSIELSYAFAELKTALPAIYKIVTGTQTKIVSGSQLVHTLTSPHGAWNVDNDIDIFVALPEKSFSEVTDLLNHANEAFMVFQEHDYEILTFDVNKESSRISWTFPRNKNSLNIIFIFVKPMYLRTDIELFGQFVIDGFDFNCCQWYYDMESKKLNVFDTTLKDCESKSLNFNGNFVRHVLDKIVDPSSPDPKKLERIAIVEKRIKKYIGKGFKPTDDTYSLFGKLIDKRDKSTIDKSSN